MSYGYLLYVISTNVIFFFRMVKNKTEMRKILGISRQTTYKYIHILQDKVES